jgi:hypothetical protein
MSVIRKGKLLASVAGQVLTVAAVGKTLVELPSSTAGATVLLDISGFSEAIDFGALGDFGGTPPALGLSAANWADALPGFLYLINGTNATAGVKLGLSRSPIYTLAPAEALFHYTDVEAATDNQSSVIVSYADGTDYNGKPMSLIGACTLTYVVASTDWTPSLATVGGCTEDALRDAFSTTYTFPVGQNGAEAGKHFTSQDGATALAFTPTNTVYYTLDRTGMCTCTHVHTTQSAPGTDGTLVNWCLPYASGGTLYTMVVGSVKLNNIVSVPLGNITLNASNINLTYLNASANGAVNDDTFANTNDVCIFTITYKAF